MKRLRSSAYRFKLPRRTAGAVVAIALLLLGASGCSNTYDDSEAAPTAGAASDRLPTAAVAAVPKTTPSPAAVGGVAPRPSPTASATAAFDAGSPSALAAGQAAGQTAAQTPVQASPQSREEIRASLAKRFSAMELRAIVNEADQDDSDADALARRELPAPASAPWPKDYTEKLLDRELAERKAAALRMTGVYHLTDAELREIRLEAMEQTLP